MPATKLLYRVPEAVEVSGMTRSRLYELMASGELESVKVGRTRLIPHASLVAFIDKLREDAAEDRRREGHLAHPSADARTQAAAVHG